MATGRVPKGTTRKHINRTHLNPLHRTTQPTASFRSTHCIVPSPTFAFPYTSFASFLSHISPFSLPSLCRIPTKLSHHFTPTRPYTFPSLFTHPSLFVIILPLLSMSHPASFHSPSLTLSSPLPHPLISLPTSFLFPPLILSSPLPHPLISLPASFHFHSRSVPLQAPSNDLQIRSSRLRSRTAHEGVNTNLTCSEPGRTRPHDGSGIVPDGD